MVDATTYLEKLGAALERRGLRAALNGDSERPMLKVTNPEAPIHEEILCRRYAGESWRFLWSWREVIGPVEKTGYVADKIGKVLRGAEQ